MKKPVITFRKGLFTDEICAVVNDRYEIYLDCGVIYDTVAAKDIPQYVFDIRDKIMNCMDSLKNCRVITKAKSANMIENY